MNHNAFDRPGKGFTITVVSLFLVGTVLSFLAMTDLLRITPFQSQNTMLLAIQGMALIMTGRVLFKYFKYRHP